MSPDWLVAKTGFELRCLISGFYLRLLGSTASCRAAGGSNADDTHSSSWYPESKTFLKECLFLSHLTGLDPTFPEFLKTV